MENKGKKPHVAILPTPAMGHIIPLIEFARKLQLISDISVIFIVPSFALSAASQKAYLQALPTDMNVLHLPPANFDDIDAALGIEARIMLSLSRSLPALRDSLKSLSESTRLVALVVDVACTDALHVATELRIPRYLFLPVALMCLSVASYLQKLDDENEDLPDLLQVPGIAPLRRRDLTETAQNRSTEIYKYHLHYAEACKKSDGIIVNTFVDLESATFKALADGNMFKPPIFAVGPLIRAVPANGDGESECLRWLDAHPARSVVYVSFGSGGRLSDDQMVELAWGLELSEQRFMWVLKNPYETGRNAFDLLPEGFVQRTRERGLLVPAWAPQVEILSHGSTGGFLSRCGWNSVLESVCHGVPFIAWPLLMDQMMNAAWLSQDLGVALRLEKEKNGLVSRNQIAGCVRALVAGEEGQELQSRIWELKRVAGLARSPDGSSSKSLAQLAELWKK